MCPEGRGKNERPRRPVEATETLANSSYNRHSKYGWQMAKTRCSHTEKLGADWQCDEKVTSRTLPGCLRSPNTLSRWPCCSRSTRRTSYRCSSAQDPWSHDSPTESVPSFPGSRTSHCAGDCQRARIAQTLSRALQCQVSDRMTLVSHVLSVK